MDRFKFRYGYTNGKDWIFKVFTLQEISNGECYEVLSDQPLMKDYKHKTIDQCTGLTANKSFRGDGPIDLLIFECDKIGFTWLNPHTGELCAKTGVIAYNDNRGCYCVIFDSHRYTSIDQIHDIEIIGNEH